MWWAQIIIGKWPEWVGEMFKNVASQKFAVFAFDSTTNLPKTGDAANITAYVSKDYGVVTVLADTSATEMDATNAKGYYLFDAAQAETNADFLLVSGKSSTANIVVTGAPGPIFTYPTTGILAPTTLGRTLDVTATGEAGIDWANVGAPTTTLALTGTTIAVTQKVDIDTIKTNPVVNGGTITFPTTATLASTTNITGGTMTTTTNLTTASSGAISEASFATTAGSFAPLGIIDQGTAQSASATTLVGRAALTDDVVKAGMTLFTLGSTQGYWQSVMIDSISGDTFTIAAWPVATPSGTITYKVFGTPTTSSLTPVPANMTQIGGNTQSATDLKDFADTGYDPATHKVQDVLLTDTLTTYTGNTVQTGDSYARLGAPAGASVSADILTKATPAQILTTALTESYAADGAAGTMAQLLFSIQAFLQERAVSGTTLTVKKLDGSTTAMTFTLSDATAPISVTRAT